MFLQNQNDSRINLNIMPMLTGGDTAQTKPFMSPRSTRAVTRFDRSINQVYSPHKMSEMGAPPVEIGDAHHVLHNYYRSKHCDKYELQTRNQYISTQNESKRDL